MSSKGILRSETVMKEKKKITLGTVIATSIGAIFFIFIAIYHQKTLANTAALASMITFAVAWSLGAAIQIVRYVRRKLVE